MADAYRRHGMAEVRATFSLFVRSLPAHRSFLVAAGLDDVLRWLEDYRIGPDDLAALRRTTTLDDEFFEWLTDLRFTGDVRAMPEGTIAFANEPMIEIDAPVAEAQLAETFVLNRLSLQTTLATKALRCRLAAEGRAVIEFGSRRAQGIDAGIALSRVSRLVGLAGTSNVVGADQFGLSASGTMAHAFVQAFEDELDAFRTFADVHGADTVLLVDTYDTPTGVDRAIQVALEQRERGETIRGIRLDSGDLGDLARLARVRLDDAGLDEVLIFASGGLDEHRITELVRAGAPIDGFGVGSALAVSDDAPVLECVYKLADYDGRPVRKTSSGKATWPGRKQVWRADDWSGDVVGLADEPGPPAHRPLLESVMIDGRRTPAGRRSLDDSREIVEHQLEHLPAALLALAPAVPHPVRPSDGLSELIAELDRAEAAPTAHDHEGAPR